LNIEYYLQPDYWYGTAESIRIWFMREIFIGQSLINLAAVAAGFFLAWVIARPLKPSLTEIIASHNLKHTTSGRFLTALEQILTFAFATILLWLFMAVFRHLGLKIYLLNLFESLLVAWVLIRLLTSVVRKAYWARFIAFTAWTVAALHILSLLKPTLVLLDNFAISVGDARLSLLLFMKAFFILFVMVRLALMVSVILKERISALDGLTPSMQVLLSKTITITLLVIAALIAISSLGIDIYTFAFIGGAVGVGIGFGLQKVVSNLVSGFVLLLDRSIKPGDVIAIDDTYGQIREMGARYLSIVTRDGAEYLIPNEDLITRQVINWSFSSTHLRIKIGVGVAYDSDVHQVAGLMIAAAQSIDRVLGEPPPVCQLKNFGENAIEMDLRFWISDPENGIANVSSAVRMAIWDAFKANGVIIPFPHRVVKILDQPPGNKLERR
jgi:small-conductance mechanosensitive channel